MAADQTAVDTEEGQVVVTRHPDGAALLYVYDGKGFAEVRLTPEKKAALIKGLELS